MAWRVRKFLTQKMLDLIVRLNRDSNYIKHVQLEVPDWFQETGPNRWIADGTVELLAVLSHQGHSGGSIHFALQFFEKMATFQPWGPLTGEEHEWSEPFDSKGTQQNKRCGRVFRDSAGRAYDIDGKVFVRPDGISYTSANSRVYVEFPYTPKTEYVNVDAPVKF